MGAADNGAREHDVFDLDALERDETPEPFEFTVAGQTFTFANVGDVDWHHAEALNTGLPEPLLLALLGDEQFADFDEIPLPGWKIHRLLKAWGDHQGVDLGEFAASSSSSANTAARSRRTSKRTTAPRSRGSQRVS